MSGHSNKPPNSGKPAQSGITARAADRRRDDTLTRLRSALLEDRLAVLDLASENTGTDPYNSGVHRTLAKGHVWDKRSR